MKDWIQPRITNLGIEETKDVEIGAPSVQYESNISGGNNSKKSGSSSSDDSSATDSDSDSSD